MTPNRSWIISPDGTYQAGFFKCRMTKGGPFVPGHLEYGQPYDPETGERLDRSFRFTLTISNQTTVANRIEDLPTVIGELITQAEHDHLCRIAAWAEGTSAPEGSPRQAIDLLTAPSPLSRKDTK